MSHFLRPAGLVLLPVLAAAAALLLQDTLNLTVEHSLLLVALAALIVISVLLYMQARKRRQACLADVAPAVLTSTLDTLSDGVMLLDNSGRIIIANQAFSTIVGCDAAALQGMPVAGLNWIPATGRDRAPPWRLSLRDGRQRSGYRLRYSGKTGNAGDFAVECTPVRDPQGRHNCVMVTFSAETRPEEGGARAAATPGTRYVSRALTRRQYRAQQTPAGLDPLTGCLSRRSFLEQQQAVFQAARRDGLGLACIMADIDMFKQIIDRYGTAHGDKAVRKVAEALRDSLRASDTICRYGREEFCILLQGMTLTQAQALAERARSVIGQLSIKGATDASAISITASFGVSSNEQQTQTLGQLIDRADKALFRSKSSGRNRVTAWSPQPDNTPAVLTGDFVPGVSTACAGKEQTAAASCHHAPADPANLPGHDSLTGLPNRKQFYARVVEAIQAYRGTPQQVAVIMLDVDMFKRINSVLGYAAGDQLLQLISDRLGNTLRSTDSVTRLDSGPRIPPVYSLGGDEFGILLTGLDNGKSIDQAVSRIIDAATEKFDLLGKEVSLTCSVGASFYPDHGTDADTLLKNACCALYHAKLQGHNSYQFYDDSLNREASSDPRISADLPNAISGQELEVYYQPQIDLDTGRVSTVEALVRWQHPDIGMIPPAEFLPVAEEAGLMPRLGYQVIETACSHLAGWLNAGHDNLRLSVNLSAAQFHHRELLKNVLRSLAAAGLEPGHLELEITENTIMSNLEAASSILRGLHDAGIRISVDDFGTGYSSLNNLKLFPISSVKIDRSFTRDLACDADDAAIVSAIIRTAHHMGLKVIAEGVETTEQLELLRSMQCDAMQGFLFSPPVPHNEASGLIDQQLEVCLAPVRQTVFAR